MLDGTQAWVGYSQKQRNIAWRDVLALGCAIPRMALAAAVTWPQNISIGRLGRTALSQAAEDGCWHNNSLVKDDCVSEQEKRGCFGTFWKDPSTLIFDGTMISFINKYLLIVSIKLYVYDCGKWPSRAWQKCAEDKGLLKVSLTIIHHVWINDRWIIDF